MNLNLLIDGIVRQTTVLIAQLATAGGTRSPLAHVADQVFIELVHELKSQGLGNKVIADMFGLALRTYHNKVRRLGESATERGRSLWEAVYAHVREAGAEQRALSRAAILDRFHRDDPASVSGVLNDLVESGLLFRTGAGERCFYRAAESVEMGQSADPVQNAASMLWVVLAGGPPRSRDELAEAVPMPERVLDAALRALLESGRIQSQGGDPPRYGTDTCIIPFGDAHGWEAAVFDHYQTMAAAIAAKLRAGATQARADEASGGSTYHFDLYDGHPLEEEVMGLLASVRERAGALRQRVDELNEQKPTSAPSRRVSFYVGQVHDELRER